MNRDLWRIEPEWQGETAFVVAGGPSLRGIDVETLRGRKVIVINSSWRAVPFADFLIFADARWWEVNRLHLAQWAGRIVCCSRTPRDKQLLLVKRCTPPGNFDERDCLPVQFTTATAAISLAAKLGASQIVLLALDGQNNSGGLTHHHQPHPWRQIPGWERKHRRDLETMIAPLNKLGIDVRHGTRGSAYADLWPTTDLTEILSNARSISA